MSDAEEAHYVAFQRWWFGEMKKVGLAAPHWPKEWGGVDLSLRNQIIIYEEIARIDAPTPDLYAISLYHVPSTLFAHGTPAQRERYLKGVLEGDQVWCQGFSEPNAGSDLASLATRAERRGATYIVNGQKIWSSNGAFADYCLLLARTDSNAPKHAGISYFILDMKSPGVTVRPIRQATGKAEFTEIFLDNVVIPAENLIGEENKGWAIAQSTLSTERGLIIFEHSERLAYALERDLEAVRKSEVEWDWYQDDEFRRAYIRVVAEVSGLRPMVRKMLSDIEANPQMGGAAMPPLIKIHYSELLRRYTELRLRIAGLAVQRREPVPRGGGYVTRNRMYDFLWSYAWTISGGTNEIIRSIIAERILGLPR
jgi:alkylation response protein AidB-like acyl-CoA dehydrogenase